MTSTATRLYNSPLGALRLEASPIGVRSLLFPPHISSADTTAPNPHLDLLARELDAYFARSLTTFTVPLDLQGTNFQQQVWRALLNIPLGQTRSYADIARAIANPAAVRAVGLANGANPIAIVVPCHRVIGARGKLVGYGGELWRKEWLLRHEGVNLPESLFPSPRPNGTACPDCASSPSPS